MSSCGSTSIAVRPRAVVDTSALVRATVPPVQADAVEWLARVHRREVAAWATMLIYAEGGQTLRNYVRARILTAPEARARLTYYLALPLRLAPLRRLAPDALDLALESGLSVYDASYAVLARALDATLVTADRRLAEHHDRVALLA